MSELAVIKNLKSSDVDGQTRREPADAGALDVRYTQMCRAITECRRVDEVKEIRDQALVLQVYTRQAKNREAERWAAEIRLRAERRAGELLIKQAKAEGTRAQLQGRDASGGRIARPPEDSARTLTEQGISKDQASKWQKVAALADGPFEAALRDPENTPSTALMVKLATAKPPLFSLTAMDGSTTMNPLSLWVWNLVRDFERKDLTHHDPAAVFGGMTGTMQADLARLVPGLCGWFARLPIGSIKS